MNPQEREQLKQELKQELRNELKQELYYDPNSQYSPEELARFEQSKRESMKSIRETLNKIEQEKPKTIWQAIKHGFKYS